MATVRLLAGHPVGADNRGKAHTHAKCIEHLFRQVLRLVGADAKAGTKSGQFIKRPACAIEKMAFGGNIVAVVGDEDVPQLVQLWRCQGDRSVAQRLCDHGPRTFTDHCADLVEADRRERPRGQRVIEGTEQVRCTFHQCAVKIEDNGPAL